MTVNEKIKALRELMKERNIDAYIVPTFDPHQSEYLADYYQTRVWLTGFTGSAGTAVVTQDDAILWTDGRYFIQAEEEIKDTEFVLYKMATPGYPTYQEWLRDNLESGQTIGVDGEVYPQSLIEHLKSHVDSKNIKINYEEDLIDEIWTDRPEEPFSEAFVHDESKYTGFTAEEKINQVREKLKDNGASHTIIGSLDDIAWLYNVRGRDVKCNPVLVSYALVSLDEAYLFINQDKLTDEVKAHLDKNKVQVRDYNEINDFVSKLDKSSVFYLDPAVVNTLLYNSLPEESKVVKGLNITTVLKGVKNETEIENQKNAYIKDGVALVNFFHWIDQTVGKEKVTEAQAADKLEEFRAEQEGFVEPSFDTIAGYKENAAMMHYKAVEGSDAELKPEGMFLVDSGGQYFDGTTDITRTLILGDISEEEKKDFTLTFKSHTKLLDARFLYGSTGERLDAICRYHMWQEGLDYKCGTGHGVGYFLNVHEGPHNVANRVNHVVLEEGMILTIEPGVYKAGKHGVRIENVVVVREDIETEHGGQFMKFELLSYVPIDLNGINKDMLTDDEIDWLNSYHKKVYEKLSPHLEDEVKEWLKEATREI